MRTVRAALWFTIGLSVGFVAWGCTNPPATPETYLDADGVCRYAATGDECAPPTPTPTPGAIP